MKKQADNARKRFLHRERAVFQNLRQGLLLNHQLIDQALEFVNESLIRNTALFNSVTVTLPNGERLPKVVDVSDDEDSGDEEGYWTDMSPLTGRSFSFRRRSPSTTDAVFPPGTK